MPMPAVVAGLLGAAIVILLKFAVWAIATWTLYKANLGWDLVLEVVGNMTGYGSGRALADSLAMPAWLEGWADYVAASNAWIPLAEGWVLLKLYVSGMFSSIATRITFKLLGGG